ncbi:hypothetical protein ACLOJK_018921 [Asimina triloba]
MGEILGNVVGFSSLDVDNVDKPFEPPSDNVPLFFNVSFVLAYEGHPVGSPSSVQWTSLGDDRGIPEIEVSVHRVIALVSDLAGSAPRDADVVPRNTTSLSGEAESPHVEGGVVARVAKPGEGGMFLVKLLAPHEAEGEGVFFSSLHLLI